MNNEYAYAEVVHGLRNRGRVYELPDVPDYYGQKVVDGYASVYRFGPDFKDVVSKSHTVTGYSGPCRAVGLHFDFDSEFNDLALRESRQFVEKICCDKYGVHIDDIRLFFSGRKGFHIIVLSEEVSSLHPATNTHEKVKRLCGALAGEFSSWDRSVYDKTRIFRIANSRHGKTGLYKIPLLAGELFTMELPEIKKLAQTQRRSFHGAT